MSITYEKTCICGAVLSYTGGRAGERAAKAEFAAEHGRHTAPPPAPEPPVVVVVEATGLLVDQGTTTAGTVPVVVVEATQLVVEATPVVVEPTPVVVEEPTPAKVVKKPAYWTTKQKRKP